MFEISSMNDLWNFMCYIEAFAPDSFPEGDVLPAGQPINLEVTFQHLEQGLQVAAHKPHVVQMWGELVDMLASARKLYAAKDWNTACAMLDEFERHVFKS